MAGAFPPGVGPRLVAMGVLAAIAGWLATNSLQQDFSAYFTAGAAAARGLDPYVNHLPEVDGPWDGISVYRHSRFLYPPLIAELWRPWAALPFAWAKTLWSACAVAALWTCLALVARTEGRGVPVGGGRVGVGAAVVRPPSARGAVLAAWLLPLAWALWPPVFVALERGQVEPLLLPVLAAAWHWRQRVLWAGALLAVAALCKPMVLGVLPLLLAARKPRWALATVGGLAVLGGASIVVSGRVLSQKYLHDVLPRAARWGEGGPERLLLNDEQITRAGTDVADGIGRSDGTGRPYRQEIGSFARNASLPRLVAAQVGDSEPSAAFTMGLALVLGGVLTLGAWRSPDSPAWYWGGLLAGVVTAPVSWAMGLVWALPLFCLAIAGPRSDGTAFRVLMGVCLVAGLLGPWVQVAWVLTALAGVAAAAVATVRTTAGTVP